MAHCRTFLPILILAATGLIGACATQAPPEPTLDELAHNPGFQQCLLDSGIRPHQVTECLAGNPDDESARACLQAHVPQKSGPKSTALYRCYHLPQQMQTRASAPPGKLNCYRGLMGVTCK